MHEPDLDPSRSAEALFADIEQYVDEALATLDSGRYVDLRALHPAVDALCERVKHLRADEAQFFVLKMEALRNQLDTLNDAMQEAKASISDEIRANEQRLKAVRAYRPPENKS